MFLAVVSQKLDPVNQNQWIYLSSSEEQFCRYVMDSFFFVQINTWEDGKVNME